MNKTRGILLGVLIVLFLGMTYLVAGNYTQNMDLMVSAPFYAIRNPGLTTLAQGITYIGNWESITIICLLLLIYPKTRFKYGIPVAAAAIFTSLVKALVKLLLARPRPDAIYHLIIQGGYSYPSGHAITSISIFVIMIIMVQKYVDDRKKANLWTALLLIPALGIGLSRIYLGVHYPSDVLGGWFAGLAIALAIWMIMDTLEKKEWHKNCLYNK